MIQINLAILNTLQDTKVKRTPLGDDNENYSTTCCRRDFFSAPLDVLRGMIEQDIALEASPRIENLLGNCLLRIQLATTYPRFRNLYPNPLILFITGKLLVTRSS